MPVISAAQSALRPRAMKMKGGKRKGSDAIMAAGGVVVRPGREPLIAVVQLRKGNAWVLPKGKLDGKETAAAAARREVLEEVGQEAEMLDFLGTICHDVGERPKIVQLWTMRAIDGPAKSPARDIKAVQWLPLEAAVEKLTHPREQEFLRHAGHGAIATIERAARTEAAEPVLPPAQAKPDTPLAWLQAWWRRMIGGAGAA
jgi:8-oxo-dGTP diphosphatase